MVQMRMFVCLWKTNRSCNAEMYTYCVRFGWYQIEGIIAVKETLESYFSVAMQFGVCKMSVYKSTVSYRLYSELYFFSVLKFI